MEMYEEIDHRAGNKQINKNSWDEIRMHPDSGSHETTYR